MDKKPKNTSTATQPRTIAHDFLTCRRVLNIMVFLGFMVNYMLRVNLTFAIVDMIAKFPNLTEEIISTEVIVLNRSARSIPEDAYFSPIDGTGNDEDEEDPGYNSKFRKNNFIGNAVPIPKNPIPLLKTSANKTFANGLNPTGLKSTGFQSFSSSGNGTKGLGSQFTSSGSFQSSGVGKPGFQTFSGGFTQFSSGRMNGSFGSFQSSGTGQSGSGAGRGFQASGGGANQSNGGFQSQSGFQASAGGAIQSNGFQSQSGFQATGGSANQSNGGFQSQSGFQATGAGANQSNGSFQSQSGFQASGAELVNSGSQASNGGISQNGENAQQSSNGLKPNDKVGAAGITSDDDVEANFDEPGSSIIGEENTNNSNILFIKDSDKVLPQVGNSKLEPEGAGGVVAINNTGDNDLLRYTRTIKIDRIRRFNWSESEQGILIGSFFWGYICTELPGGRLAEIVGARRVFGYATLGASVVTLLTPLSAKIHFIMAVIIRILLGLFLGVTWPSILPLAAKWIPPDERGKFLSNMMGSTLGAGFTLPICGLIIAHFSWEYVFYITGLLGFIWSVIWFLLVFETPADHPRISPEERWYIETKLGLRPSKDLHTYSQEEKQVSQGLIINQSGDESCLSDNEQKTDEYNRNYSTFAQNGITNGANSDTKNHDNHDKKSSINPDSDTESAKKSTPLTLDKNSTSASNGKTSQAQAQEQSSHANAPWFHILTSVPVWAFVLTHGASVFGYNTITNQLPTYMNYILHYDIKQNGFLSSLPYIGKYIAALIGGCIADKLLTSSRFSKNFIRKLFTCIAVMIPGFLMLLQIFFGNHEVISIVIFTAALTANGCVTGGYLGNSLDIAPNYSGTVFGLGNMFSGLSGALSAILVGFLTNHNQVYGQWQKVFFIVAITYLAGALIFLVFGSTEVQWWNSATKTNKKKNEVDSDIDEETVILQAGRRRSSVSSLLRYTEDEWSQSNYSSGIDSNKSRKRYRRKEIRTDTESESFDSSKPKNLKSSHDSTKTPSSKLIPLINDDTHDSDSTSDYMNIKSKYFDSCKDIKLRKNRHSQNEDFLLSVKKRTSYKEAIENGSHSDYSYESVHKAHLKNTSDDSSTTERHHHRKKIQIDEKIRSRRNTRDEDTLQQKTQRDENSSCESDNENETTARAKKYKTHVRSDEYSDESIENVSNFRRKRSKIKFSKELDDNESENETSKQYNGTKKSRKTHKPEPNDQTENIKKKIHRIPKDSTNNEKPLKTDQPSTSRNVEKSKESSGKDHQDANTRRKKFRLSLSQAAATIKHSLSSPQ